jgi:hypothetical protein
MVASLPLLLKIFLLVSNYTLDIQVLSFGVLAISCGHLVIANHTTTPSQLSLPALHVWNRAMGRYLTY